MRAAIGCFDFEHKTNRELDLSAPIETKIQMPSSLKSINTAASYAVAKNVAAWPGCTYSMIVANRVTWQNSNTNLFLVYPSSRFLQPPQFLPPFIFIQSITMVRVFGVDPSRRAGAGADFFV